MITDERKLRATLEGVVVLETRLINFLHWAAGAQFDIEVTLACRRQANELGDALRMHKAILEQTAPTEEVRL